MSITKRLILLIGALFIISDLCLADTITKHTTYTTTGEVNAANLNGNLDNIINEVNGNLSNDNIKTASGYRLFEILGALPAVGTQGRTVYLTTDNTMNFDTGTAYVKAITTSAATQGDIVYYNGTAWARLGYGTANLPLVTNGVGANPAYEVLATSAGGTGSTAAANAASGVVVLDASSKLPAVDGSSLTGIFPNTTRSAFLASPASQQANIVAGGNVTIVFGTEIFDQASNFASNTFTAPSTGKYQLSYAIYFSNLDSASTNYAINIVTSNRTYQYNIDVSKFSADVAQMTYTMSILADMDINDTAYVIINQTGGANQTDIETGSYFSGFLAT